LIKCLLFIEPKKKIMKKKLFQILSFAVILAFMMPAFTHAQAGKANFAGNWAVNAEKSTQPQQPAGGNPPAGGQGGGGGRGGFGMGPLAVTQEANLLSVETSRTNQSGETTKTTMKYTLDGKESVNTNPRGDSKSVATWSADGKSLTIVTTRTMDVNGESRTIITTAVWAMDGANLSVTTTTPTQNGDRVVKLVYDKK
jgi:hypothetical protein